MKPVVNIDHLAVLSNLTPSPEFKKKLSDQFAATLKVVSELHQLDTSQVNPTPQDTGKINQTRPDVIDTDRMLTQAQALSNAAKAYNGYFVVNRILN